MDHGIVPERPALPPRPGKIVARANRNQKMKGRSWVYFAQIGRDGPIKIGQSRQVHTRIRALATAHPCEIRLLGTIPETVVSERSLLNAFGDHCIRGEWFSPTPDLVALARAGAAIYSDGYVVMAADKDEAAWSIIAPFSIMDRYARALANRSAQGASS